MDLNSNKHVPKYPVQTLEKALDVIEMFYKKCTTDGLGISELSNQLGIGKSTVHRILDTLGAYGYIEKKEDSTKYRLGWRMFEIGNVVPRQRSLNNFNVKILQAISDRYGETVNLGVKVDNDVVTINKIEPTSTLMASLQVGQREPLYATAMGKVIISDFTDNEIIEVFGKQKLKKYTPNTIDTIDELIYEIKKVREEGYSIDDEEYCIGLSCIAMPIRNYKEEIVAAVSVSGPSVRLNFNKIMEIKDGLKDAVKELSNYLGYKELNES